MNQLEAEVLAAAPPVQPDLSEAPPRRSEGPALSREDESNVARALAKLPGVHEEVSVSWFQRRLRIGYVAAGQVIEALLARGALTNGSLNGRYAVVE